MSSMMPTSENRENPVPSGISAAQPILIEATLRNAARTSFYRERWGGPVELIDFSALPIVSKPELMRAGEDAQIRTDGRFGEKFTTGTTGEPFVNIVGAREQRALARLHQQMHARYRHRPAPRGVRFHDTHVAFAREIPSPARFHDLSIYGAGSFNFALRTIEKKQDERGVEPACSILVAGDRILRALTAFAEQRADQPVKSSLRHIITYSNYLTPRARAWYARVWGVAVTDRYGLSEAVGGATQDPECGWYHFDPVVVPEVVGHRSQRPMREGVGVLVLTTLFPFQQCQPLVRYWTGDVVEVTHSRSSRPGQLAIKPLGRIDDAIPSPHDDDWLLTPDIAFQILEDRDDVVRHPLFRDSAQVADPHWCGLPQYSVKRSQSDIDVRSFVDFSFSVPSLDARDMIFHSIRGKSASLATAEMLGMVVLRHRDIDGELTVFSPVHAGM